MTPTLSIMVPVYKVEKYIHKCIESILSQTYTDFELILINDGSPDNSGKICDEYQKKDKRIVVIHKENSGLADTRNVALKQAKGKYLGIVDSDDYVAPNMYETLISVMEETESDLVICDNYRVVENDDVITVQNWLEKPQTFTRDDAMYLLLMDKIGSQAWNKLYKKELFYDLEYPVGRTFCQDLALTYKYFHRCNKIVYIKEPLYYYLIRETSASFNFRDSNRLHHVFLGFKERYQFAKKEYPKYEDECLKLVAECGLSVCYNAMASHNYAILDEVLHHLRQEKRNIMRCTQFSAMKKQQLSLLTISPKIYYLMQTLKNYFCNATG